MDDRVAGERVTLRAIVVDDEPLARDELTVPDTIPLVRFAVRRKNAYVVVNLTDVVYFEARDEFVWAVTTRDRFALDRTLATLAEQLDSTDFFQSHRSCIVRIDRIRMIEPAGARTFRMLLDHPDEPKVPLARDRVGKLRERIPFLR